MDASRFRECITPKGVLVDKFFYFEMQRQKADALMKTANDCKDQLLQKDIDHNVKVAKMIQELKDQLSKEKIKIIEEKSATEARNYPNMKWPLTVDDIT